MKTKTQENTRPVILIGNPNVGKSVIFGILTGQYVVVSNYPGTTVEISRGKAHHGNHNFDVIDTPGIANLLPMSQDEVVTRDILLKEEDSTIVQVADSKNLNRTFLITLQLIEMGLPFVLVMNMVDEARERRIDVDYRKLSEILGVDIFPTVAVSRTGTGKILPALSEAKKSNYSFKYDPFIEDAIDEVEKLLPDFPISKRSIALMILSEDESLNRWLDGKISNEDMEKIEKVVRELRNRYPDSIELVINKERLKIADQLKNEVATFEDSPRKGFLYEAGKICTHPVWGIPILIAVLYLMWFFVGKITAGDIVDFLYSNLFGNLKDGTGLIVPYVGRLLKNSSPLVKDFFVGEYGLISVGIAYALAIVLPIVAAFFLFFSILEDSGYLPRLAITANKLCNTMGLNGKAILPLVLGLGCGAMATIASRILDTPKERMMVILLLSLGVPCSAQMGVITGLLAGLNTGALLIWLFIVIGSMILVGKIANKLIPGESSDFVLEIPPIRIPNLKNIVIKTLARIEWYLKEAVPVFLLATFILFVLDKTGVLLKIQTLSSPIIGGLLGLPPKATNIFLMGFLRRDYGAAGILEMVKDGLLNHNQVLVSIVTITLFLPCVAQLFIIVKEKGFKEAFLVSAFVFVFAFLVGGLLNYILNTLGVVL